MSNLIYNAIRTPDGTILVSTHRHDFVSHKDANGKRYFVDGGLDYIRCSANGDEVSLALYDSEPHALQRELLTWGTYGKDGKQPFHRISIAEMETEHIEAVLEECNPMQVLKNCQVL